MTGRQDIKNKKPRRIRGFYQASTTAGFAFLAPVVFFGGSFLFQRCFFGLGCRFFSFRQPFSFRLLFSRPPSFWQRLSFRPLFFFSAAFLAAAFSFSAAFFKAAFFLAAAFSAATFSADFVTFLAAVFFFLTVFSSAGFSARSTFSKQQSPHPDLFSLHRPIATGFLGRRLAISRCVPSRRAAIVGLVVPISLQI